MPLPRFTPSRILLFALPFALAAAPAHAQTTVNAAGNPFTGGLEFMPAEVTVDVGDTVRWRNTDFLAPHTATERSGLWDLGGAERGTPFSPSGFGPGSTVQRPFEAGTHNYYCRVHGTRQNGKVLVPPALAVRSQRRIRRTRRGRRRVTIYFMDVRWASSPPAADRAFDVERRRPDGEWIPLATATTAQETTFRAGSRGRVWELRARLRSASDATKATDWSPVASATVG